MLGNTFIEEKGIDWVNEYLRDEIFPFFKLQEYLLTSTNTNIIDSFGRYGRGLYTYSVDTDNNKRPIALSTLRF